MGFDYWVTDELSDGEGWAIRKESVGGSSVFVGDKYGGRFCMSNNLYNVVPGVPGRPSNKMHVLIVQKKNKMFLPMV
jgi:hypothetical protein